VALKLGPEPTEGLAPFAVHANVKGEDPPEPVALQDTAMPTVPVGEQLIMTDTVDEPITTSAKATATWEVLSVKITLTRWEPVVLKVVEKLLPVPESGLPPPAIQPRLYGGVPPVGKAVQETIVPTVPVEGQCIVTAKADVEGTKRLVA